MFVDPPGLFAPSNLLQQSMVESAAQALRTADVVLYLHAATDGVLPPLGALVPELRPLSRPVATVLTKVDLVPVADLAVSHAPQFAISAVTGQGIPELLSWCRAQIPVGPFRYDSDDLSSQNLRFFAAELVREAAFELLEQELPYALAAEIDQFRESPRPVYIRAVLYVERISQKGMVIGQSGRTIKALGSLARSKIEALLGEKVYLDLWVKVLPKWRTTASALKMLGMPAPNRERHP